MVCAYLSWETDVILCMYKPSRYYQQLCIRARRIWELKCLEKFKTVKKGGLWSSGYHSIKHFVPAGFEPASLPYGSEKRYHRCSKVTIYIIQKKKYFSKKIFKKNLFRLGLRPIPRERPRFGPSVLLRLSSNVAQSDGASDVSNASGRSSHRVAPRPRATRKKHGPH